MTIENHREKMIKLLASVYSAAPKDHNPKGFIDEFVSRVRAASKSETMRSFYSTLMRKVKATDIYDAEQFGSWISGLDKKTENQLIEDISQDGQFYILMAKEHLNIVFDAQKEKNSSKNNRTLKLNLQEVKSE